MLKEIISTVLAAVQLAAGSLTVLPDTSSPEEVSKPEHSYIIHAGGEIQGYFGTNSLDALENAYSKGNRYIEIDFSFSSDLRPVCIHDWNHLSYSGYDGTKPTSEEFANSTVYSMFTSLTLEKLCDFMKQHEDLYIVTDVKDHNMYFSGILKREYPELCDRFIIQVYSEEQYDFISRLGFENIIFSLYKLDYYKQMDTDYLVSFAKEHRLYAYTFNAVLCDTEGYVDAMLECGIPLFIHTVNDKQMQKKYFDMGISGIYTDNTTHE